LPRQGFLSLKQVEQELGAIAKRVLEVPKSRCGGLPKDAPESPFYLAIRIEHPKSLQSCCADRTKGVQETKEVVHLRERVPEDIDILRLPEFAAALRHTFLMLL